MRARNQYGRATLLYPFEAPTCGDLIAGLANLGSAIRVIVSSQASPVGIGAFGGTHPRYRVRTISVRRLILQDDSKDNEVSTTRMIIVCTLTCSLVLWVGFVWAVVHFLA
jgi:hypothetical protein